MRASARDVLLYSYLIEYSRVTPYSYWLGRSDEYRKLREGDAE